MNGTVEVRSEYMKGSVFSVTLPQKVTDHTPVPTELSEMRTTVTKSARHLFTAPGAVILAVDDNRPNLSIVKAFLKETEIKVDLCTNGNDALKMCREKQYDLILMDHMMPEPDGIQTLEMIRRDPESRNRETAAVVLTANALNGSRQMYLRSGFADYLSKPLDADVLEKTVQELLPAEKVRITDRTEGQDDDILEFEAAGPEDTAGTELPEALRKIKGLDVDEGLNHTGGNTGLLRDILADIASGGKETAKELRQCAEKKDYEKYRITSHSIKSLMAPIGAGEMSSVAKRNEYAARNGEYIYIEEHYGAYAKSYEDLCQEILKALRGGK